MEIIYNKRFKKDLKDLSNNRSLLKEFEHLMLQLKTSESLKDIPNVKKMSGEDIFYRIRMGNYRIGLSLIGQEVTLYRFLHRKEMYRYFP